MKYLMGKISDKIKEYYETGEMITTSFMDPRGDC